ncbi:glycoside hydrolase family 3 C-terminal domain-containing protein [Microbacterium aquilitoris]|uniref:Glycoside hydrolase family 3 C-terminal domain-containing protein n=1 Tax=Microbacterium aquilitoris TaxID=3067307 RepID=A0ABU3GGE3_9MICO|nr:MULTISPECIES: glycoside hydrolase family 3 C-terminal domain-containing protein [unclassified Microbacterium]MDT3329773.1 glycoside hydrolase family 3 C-terminal domain-containing protein [Microbacterium sp. KSW-18]MDT3345607.1 glycoside hydrolase family 3 C-terminal domain-containing protein [Microbacterium sp. KSW2-22]
MTVDAFRRIDVPLAERSRDLLERLTPEERVAMLHQAMPAVERLGIRPFHTGCEALHGLAWVGVATVFPQPVGLAATWDPELVRRVGDLVATEVRAKRASGADVDLNVWAPVVNTLRHPAWGRNEEGYSEDPHYTGQLGAAYSRGLRGDHPRVWKTVPSLKHFLAYSNETDRSATSSEMSPRTLHEEELPAFRPAIEQKVAGSMMLAYNRVNGVPAHTQPELVAEARSWSDESIAVVSDAGAPSFLVSIQRAQPDKVHGAAALVRSGMDSFTDDGPDSAPSLEAVRGALAQGLLTDEDVDAAVLRLLDMRLRTGEFDGDDDPYAAIGPDEIDTPAARELAREAVARQVVLLRNDAGVLPFAEPASVSVVGPMADVVLTDWYSGTPPYAVGIAQGVRDRYPTAAVEVVTGADTVVLRAPSGYVAAAADGTVDAILDARTDASLFDVTDWGDGILTLRSHASGRLLTGGAWPMRADAERVGGWVVQESFRRHVHEDGSWSLLHLGSGRWVRVVRDVGLLVAEGVTLDDAARFEVETVTRGLDEVARAAAAADVVLVAVGNDPHLSGRETADRLHLLLPTAATDLWRAARSANPRSVLTIVSSFPYVLADAADAATVVWSSHAGQELGHGLLDVLSGDREPAGRLAQSWPAHPDQAGDLFDYDTRRQQATYRHQPDPYAFAFGHGLGYGDVAYEAVEVDAGTVTAPAPTLRHPALDPRDDEQVVTASVRVANRSERAVEELVQLYAVAPELPIAAPRRLLLGYARVRIEPGEARTAKVRFTVERLAVWDGEALRVQAGDYRLAAGPSADALDVSTTLTVRD